jgi:tRNA threonylcarbamoyladenosine biosynthesis protein TsaB
MKILAIDTATPSCSVALVDADHLLAEQTVVSRRTHAEHLAPMIQQTTSAAGLRLADVEGFAVSRGPGSFTGLRIGISTVKGLSLASDRPLVGISTLEALAAQCGPTSRMICSLIDARKGQLYYAGYRWIKRRLVTVDAEQVIDPADLALKLRQPCVIVGNGALLQGTWLTENPGAQIEQGPSGHHIPRASTVAGLGYRRLASGECDDAAAIVPTYIRKSDAELAGKQ